MKLAQPFPAEEKSRWTKDPLQNKEKSISVNPSVRFTGPEGRGSFRAARVLS